MSPKALKAILCAIGAMWAIGSARADVTYVYTGNDFAGASPPFTLSDNVTAVLIFENALPPDLTPTGLTPVSWTISAGALTISNANGSLTSSSFATNQSGNITGWDVAAGTTEEACVECSIQTANFVGASMDSSSSVGDSFGYNVGDPGTWSTPEPSSAATVALALSALGWLRTRQTFRNPKTQEKRHGQAA